MKRMLEDSPNRLEPEEILATSRALEIESVLQTWRAGQRPEWRPALRLAGFDHLDRALAAGAGAILWVGHFVYASLCAKMALHDAGHKVFHLSHPRHGFSTTRFGIRFLNPARQKVEIRYLAERIELSPANPAIALRHLQKHLGRNGVVSITAIADAARPAFPPFLGDRIALATGAADLAYRSGADLLPVFVRRDETGVITVEIEAPLPVDRNLTRRDSSAAAARAFAERQAVHVRAQPEQWLGWPTLPPREPA